MGLEYSQFCTLYRQWRKTQDVVLPFEHMPGDKLFVGYAGYRFHCDVSVAHAVLLACRFATLSSPTEQSDISRADCNRSRSIRHCQPTTDRFPTDAS